MFQIVRSSTTLFFATVLAAYAATLASKLAIASIASVVLGGLSPHVFWGMTGFMNGYAATLSLASVFVISAYVFLVFVLWEKIFGPVWWKKTLFVWVLLIFLNGIDSEMRTVSAFLILSGVTIPSHLVELFALWFPLLLVSAIAVYGAQLAHARMASATPASRAARPPSVETNVLTWQRILLGLHPVRYRALAYTILLTWFVACLLPLAFSSIAYALSPSSLASITWTRVADGGQSYWISCLLTLLPATTYTLLLFAAWERIRGASLLQKLLPVILFALIGEGYVGILITDLTTLALYGTGTLNFYTSAQLTGYVLTLTVPASLVAHISLQKTAGFAQKMGT